MYAKFIKEGTYVYTCIVSLSQDDYTIFALIMYQNFARDLLCKVKCILQYNVRTLVGQ